MSRLKRRVDELSRKNGAGIQVVPANIPPDLPEEKWSEWIAREEAKLPPLTVIADPRYADV